MKKALFIGIFSLVAVAIAPVHCVLAQVFNASDTQAHEKSSAVATKQDSPNDLRKFQDPAPETTAAISSAKNSTVLKETAKSTAAISDNPLSGATVEARKKYDDGMTLYDSGKLSDAIAAFKRADKLKPDDPQIHYMLGMVYSKSKAYKDAADSFKHAVRFKPDWPEAHFKLGTMSYVLGRRSQSLEEYKKLMELNSALANRLYDIIKEESSAAGRAESVALESEVSAQQIEAVRVSASAKETPVPADAGPKRTAPGTKPLSSAPVNPALRSDSNDPVPGLGSTRAASDDLALTSIYKIGVGDVLDIRLLNSTTTRSTLYTVVDGGLIDFPIAGVPISVAGLTVDEVQARIASELKRRAVEAHLSVGVRQYASHTLIITGLIGNPGNKILRREAVPLYVIMADAQPRVDAGRVAIMRAGATEQILDLSVPGTLNFTVRPGDVINVTARPPEFYYIAGRINYPGQKVFQPGITLLQAILAAGGMARQHDNAIELSRESADGRLVTTKFNLKEIKSGKIQDPRLQPGDRIEVVR
jgi:protein involved in polysaccharide export with SLBB domain/Flp pilus assembly protein TadD